MKFYIKIFNNTERKFGTMIKMNKKSEKSYFFVTAMKTTMRYDCQYDNKLLNYFHMVQEPIITHKM